MTPLPRVLSRGAIPAVAVALFAALAGCGAATVPADVDPAADTVTTSIPPTSSPPTTREDAHASYSLTSGSYTIKGDGHLTVKDASCADGYYVRVGPPSVWTPTAARNPSLSVNVDNTSWVKVWSTTPENQYGDLSKVDHAENPYRSFDVTFYSETPYTHHLTFTWWCDAISPWYDATTGNRKSTGFRGSPDIDPPEPWSPDCYYCNADYDIVENDGNGMVMNNAEAKIANGNPVISWPDTKGARNQQWHFNGLGFRKYLPVYGIWTGTADKDKAAIVADSSHNITIRTSQGGAPSGGSWYYLDGFSDAIGPNNNSIMLVDDSDERCLAANPDQGTQLITLPCNTWDRYQWWTVGDWKK
ncbi:MAG TPA: hypothetical protein VME22_13380 [Solirubrobacteraceae bacterium]|nr:hypothetical protein [Solirubrobacteraceae bacterium]